MADPRDIDYAVLTDEQLAELYDDMVRVGIVDSRMTVERGIRRFQRLLPVASRSTIEMLFTKHPNPFTVSQFLSTPALQLVKLLAMALNATDGAARGVRPFLDDLTPGGRILMDQALKVAAKEGGSDRRADACWQGLYQMALQLQAEGIPREEWHDVLGKTWGQMAAAERIETLTGMDPLDWTRWIQAVEVAEDELDAVDEPTLPPDLALSLAVKANGPFGMIGDPMHYIIDYFRSRPPAPPKQRPTLKERMELAKRYYEEARAQGAFPLALREQRENPLSERRKNDLVTLPNGKRIWGNGDDIKWVKEEIMERVLDRVETITRLEKVPAVQKEAMITAYSYLTAQGITPTTEALRHCVVQMEEADPELKARMYVEREERKEHWKEVPTGRFRDVPKHFHTLDSIMRRKGPIDPMEIERLTRDLRG